MSASVSRNVNLVKIFMYSIVRIRSYSEPNIWKGGILLNGCSLSFQILIHRLTTCWVFSGMFVITRICFWTNVSLCVYLWRKILVFYITFIYDHQMDLFPTANDICEWKRNIIIDISKNNAVIRLLKLRLASNKLQDFLLFSNKNESNIIIYMLAF